jgi:hypothetical protein
VGNLWWRLALPRQIGTWSLTSLQQRLLKTGGRLLKHARYYWLLLAESHLTRRLFGSMLEKDRGVAVAGGLGGCLKAADIMGRAEVYTDGCAQMPPKKPRFALMRTAASPNWPARRVFSPAEPITRRPIAN